MTNIFEPSWHAERCGNPLAMVAAACGAQRLGASVVELAPGKLSSPYHFHHANEELLIVLSGTPQLRTADGVRELAAGDVVSFPRGLEGAHRLRNTSREPCRVLFVSEMSFPDVVEYPDIGATVAVTAAATRLAFPDGCDQPLPDVVAAALDADNVP